MLVDEILDFFKIKKNLINLLLVAILVVAIPLGVRLIREQQIISSRAAQAKVEFLTKDQGGTSCVELRSGTLVATCKDVTVRLTSPFGLGTPPPPPPPPPGPPPPPPGPPPSASPFPVPLCDDGKDAPMDQTSKDNNPNFESMHWETNCKKPCSTRADCPVSTDEGITGDNTRWCYGFGKDTSGNDQNRCLMLRWGRACTLEWFGTVLSPSCVSCIANARPDVVKAYNNEFGQVNCSLRRQINDWCLKVDPNGCNPIRSGQCASQCGGGGGGGCGTITDALLNFVWQARPDLALDAGIKKVADTQGIPAAVRFWAIWNVPPTGTKPHPESVWQPALLSLAADLGYTCSGQSGLINIPLIVQSLLPKGGLVSTVYARHDDGCGATNSCSTGDYCDGNTLCHDQADGGHSCSGQVPGRCGVPNEPPPPSCDPTSNAYDECDACPTGYSRHVVEYKWSDGSGVCWYDIGACNQPDAACDGGGTCKVNGVDYPLDQGNSICGAYWGLGANCMGNGTPRGDGCYGGTGPPPEQTCVINGTTYPLAEGNSICGAYWGLGANCMGNGTPRGDGCYGGTGPPGGGNCNATPVCAVCTSTNECGPGTQTCQYTTLSGSTSCTPVPAPSKSCTKTCSSGTCVNNKCQTSSPSPSGTPKSSGTPTPSGSPTPPPGVGTASFKIAENAADLASAPDKSYTSDPMDVAFSFANENAEKKFVWVEFKATNGQTQRLSASIDMVGADPTFGLSCNLDPDGAVNITLIGSGFGTTQGTTKLTINGNAATVVSWKNDNIQAKLVNTASGNQKFSVILHKDKGSPVTQECTLGIFQLSLGAKLFCHAPNQREIKDVEIGIIEASPGAKPVLEKVSINKDGVTSGLKAKVQDGKKYKLSIKAPRTLRKVVEFTGASSTSVVPKLTLDVGDIFPTDDGDGKVNSLDKGELNRQWVIGVPAQDRSGDFNQDTRVNSIDWACMRDGFNKEDAPELK